MKSNIEIKSKLNYMKKKSSDLSQKVWLSTFEGLSLVVRNGGYKWLLFFLSGLRPCQPFFTRVKLLGERTRGGAHEPPGMRKCAKVSSFEGGTEGGKTFLLM
jgi:hypothetical protein